MSIPESELAAALDETIARRRGLAPARASGSATRGEGGETGSVPVPEPALPGLEAEVPSSLRADLGLDVDEWAPSEFPRVHRGFVIPALSAPKSRGSEASVVPVGSVGRVFVAEKGIGVYLSSGAPVILWAGTSEARHEAHASLLVSWDHWNVARR